MHLGIHWAHGLAKSTIHRHLKSLCEEKYVTKNGALYRVGLKSSRSESTPVTRLTDSTIIDEEGLFAELEEIREREYSVNDQENTEGL